MSPLIYNVQVDGYDKVEVCVHGLGLQYKVFKISIETLENIPNFADLMSMLIIEERNLGEDQPSQSKNSFGAVATTSLLFNK